MKAIVIEPVCPLMSRPQLHCERADEVLAGMVVDLLEEVKPGWYLARAPYRYEGYLQAQHVLTGDHLVRRWTERPKRVVLKGICDVLSGPAVACFPLATLTRGAILSPAGTPNADGWLRVELPDGREGYTKCSFLGEYYEKPRFEDPDQLRKAVVETALTYRGAHYRWGGKTPMGIDCSGLVSMSYLLNGVVIYRDARIQPGFPIRPVPLVIKNWTVRFFSWMERGHVTAVLSNLGRIAVPEALEPYIRGFSAFSTSEGMFTCVCSYGDDLVLGTASALRSTNVLRQFYSGLAKNGLQVTLYATEVQK